MYLRAHVHLLLSPVEKAKTFHPFTSSVQASDSVGIIGIGIYKYMYNNPHNNQCEMRLEHSDGHGHKYIVHVCTGAG